jgi:hypothetical protein
MYLIMHLVINVNVTQKQTEFFRQQKSNSKFYIFLNEQIKRWSRNKTIKKTYAE